MTTPGSSRLGLAAALGAGVCWGSIVVMIKVAARGIPISTITAIEVFTALVVLAAMMVLRGRRLPRPGWFLIAAGVLEPGLAYPLINLGLERTSGTHGSVIIGLESVAVVLGDALWRRLRPSARVVLAVVVTTAGTALVTTGGGGAATTTGDLLITAGVLVAAGYVLLAARRPAHTDSVTATFYQFLFGGLTVLVITVATSTLHPGRTMWGSPTTGEVTAAIATGLVGSAAAFLLYNWALDKISPALAGTSLTVIPVFGIVFSAIFLGDTITCRTVIGTGAVLAGIALAASPTPHDRDAGQSAAAAPGPAQAQKGTPPQR